MFMSWRAPIAHQLCLRSTVLTALQREYLYKLSKLGT